MREPNLTAQKITEMTTAVQVLSGNGERDRPSASALQDWAQILLHLEQGLYPLKMVKDEIP